MSAESEEAATVDAATPENDDNSGSQSNVRWQECLSAAIQYYHEQLDSTIRDLTNEGEHSDHPTTAREYFAERGWSSDTIEKFKLGWAAPDDGELRHHLAEEGYSEEEMLATGLFTEDLRPLWNGRYVFPYLNSEGEPTYAISRSTGGGGGDGHPEDFMSTKYAKIAHSKDYSCVSEPIFGHNSISQSDSLIITEGIADAITIQQEGYACISPVTTSFSQSGRTELLALLKSEEISRVFVIQDGEYPLEEANISERSDIPKSPPGIRGAIKTASFLVENGIDARVNTPPQIGCEKLDVDDYIREEWGTVDALKRSAIPPGQHQEAATIASTTPLSLSEDEFEPSDADSSENQSGIFSFAITDVSGVSANSRGMNPLGHTGDSEDYFVVSGNGEWAYDHKRGASYNALTYLLCDAGLRRVGEPGGSLSNKERFAAWKHAKRNGLLPDSDPIPHHGLIHIAVENGLCELSDIEDENKLPTAVYNSALEVVREEHDLDPGRDPYSSADDSKNLHYSLPDTTGSSPSKDSLTLSEARKKCQTAINNAITNEEDTLIDALPAQGKSRGVVKAADAQDEPLTVLAPRRELLHDEYAEWCDDLGLSCQALPAFQRDCPSIRGEHGEAWKSRMKNLYDANVFASEIHNLAHKKFTDDPPCCEDGKCEYIKKWEFDPSDYDVILGHYTHAYREDVTEDRVVVIDETPEDAFIEEFDHDTVSSAVGNYVKKNDYFPFTNYADLTEQRFDEARKKTAIAWFEQENRNVKRDGFSVMIDKTGKADAYAPLLTYAILTGEDLGNGWEHAELPNGEVCVRNRDPDPDHDESELSLLQPPQLDDSKCVLGLDGTPWPNQWELCLGRSLNHEKVLDDDERASFLGESLNLSIYQIGNAAKPYSSGMHVNPEKDTALLEYISDQENSPVDLISTQKAISQYGKVGALDSVGNTAHYGNIKGSNKLKDSRIGAVIGSQHYGDTYLKKWGAFANEPVEREERGDYGSFGNEILHNMREDEVLQALMRFVRTDDDTTIYVYTSAIPDWVPIEAKGEIKTWSDGMKQVVAAIEGLDEWKTADLLIEEGDKLDSNMSDPISKRQTRRNLNTLSDFGFLETTTEGCGTLWQEAAMDEVTPAHQVLFER